MNLDENQLVSLPPTLGDVATLEVRARGCVCVCADGYCVVSQVLTFNDNELDNLPCEIYQLDHLRIFGMDDNPLEKIPVSDMRHPLPCIARACLLLDG